MHEECYQLGFDSECQPSRVIEAINRRPMLFADAMRDVPNDETEQKEVDSP